MSIKIGNNNKIIKSKFVNNQERRSVIKEVFIGIFIAVIAGLILFYFFGIK